MNAIFTRLMNDEAGFIISAELVLVASIAVLAMIVGLSEVAQNVSHELEDVGSSFGSINQTFHVNGLCGHGAHIGGSCFTDQTDFCDGANDINGCNPTGEGNGSW
jgi:Flp pilus assembly pilin Flp